MDKFIGYHFGEFKKSASFKIDVVGLKGDLFLTIHKGVEVIRSKIIKGDEIIDPITDDIVTVIYCSSNGFYVQSGKKKYVIPLKDGLFYNF